MHMVTQERIEYKIRGMDSPVVTVGEVVEALDEDASDTHVRQKMDLLAAAGTLEKKKVGARAIAWWHTDRVTPPAADPADHPDQADLQDAAAAESDTDGAQTDRDRVDELDLPGSEQKVEKRRLAVIAVLDYLDSHGPAQASEIREAVYQSHPAEYGTESGWWNMMKDALGDLRDGGRVELLDRAAGRWDTR